MSGIKTVVIYSVACIVLLACLVNVFVAGADVESGIITSRCQLQVARASASVLFRCVSRSVFCKSDGKH